MTNKWRSDQRGETSMVTVAAFMLLFSVIVVGFTTLVINSARQTLNQTLQSTAQSAAEAGVEDAKRMLVYCYANYDQRNADYKDDNAKALCQNVVGRTLEHSNCNTVLGAVNDANGLGISKEKEGNDYRVPVGETAASDGESGTRREYYQCLKIATRSNDYVAPVDTNKSLIIPLNLVDGEGRRKNPTAITISWHDMRNADGADGRVVNQPTGSGLPTQSRWNSSGNWPAVLRTELVYTKANASVEDLVNDDYAVTLRPSTSGNDLNLTGAYPTNKRQQPNQQNVPYSTVSCKTGDSGYSCTMKLSVGSGNGKDYSSDTNTNYTGYLRLNAIYKTTHVKVTAENNGEELMFDGVQPVVDVTGRSGDSFARIQARLRAVTNMDNNNDWYPEYAVQTDGKICKKLNVFWDNGEDQCDY